MNLFQANRQWAERPPDERFSSLEEMHRVCKEYAESAAEAKIPHHELRVEAVEGEVQLVGRSGPPARFTHWGLGQLCRRVAAPADYLTRLPATLAVQNITHGLKALSQRADNPAASDAAYLLFHRTNGDPSTDGLVRAFTSQWYARIWNWQVVEQLMRLPEGWRMIHQRRLRGTSRREIEERCRDRKLPCELLPGVRVRSPSLRRTFRPRSCHAKAQVPLPP